MHEGALTMEVVKSKGGLLDAPLGNGDRKSAIPSGLQLAKVAHTPSENLGDKAHMWSMATVGKEHVV
jgi:hypothetical protein